MTRQEKEAPREIVSKKATMPKEKVPITETRRSESSYSLATKRSCAPIEKQEKHTLWDSAQGLERMSVKRNECVTMLIEEHDS